VALNSLWLLIARVVGQGLMVVFTVLVARHLGQVGLGQYAFVAAVVFVGNVLTTFGLDTFLIREAARRRTAPARSVTAALGIQLGLSALFIGGVALGTGRLRGAVSLAPTTVQALRLYSLSLIPLAFTTVFSASLRAYERMDLILALNLLSATAQTGGAWVLLRTGGQLVALMLLLLGVQTVTALVAGGMCFRLLPGFSLTLRISPTLVWRMLRQGALLVLIAGLAVLYQRMGVLTLSLLAGDAVTGWFAAAARLADGFKIVPYAFFGAVFPLMSRSAVAGQFTGIGEDAGPPEDRLVRNSLPLLLGFGLLAALTTNLLAGPVIRWLYGADYSPSIPALRILVWGLVPFAFNTYAFFRLISRGKEKVALQVYTMSVGSAVLWHSLLIPLFGLIGACAATLLGEMTQAALYLSRPGMGIPGLRGDSGATRGFRGYEGIPGPQRGIP